MDFPLPTDVPTLATHPPHGETDPDGPMGGAGASETIDETEAPTPWNPASIAEEGKKPKVRGKKKSGKQSRLSTSAQKGFRRDRDKENGGLWK